MRLVKWTAYGCFGTAGLNVLLAFAQGMPILLAGAIAIAMTGVGFLAAHHGLSLLTDIRDAVRPPGERSADQPLSPAVPADQAPAAAPVRTAAEIARDLAEIRQRQ